MTSCRTHGMAIDTYSVSVFVVRGQKMKVRHNFTRKLANALNLLKSENTM